MANPHPKLRVKMKRKAVYSWAVRHNTTLAHIANRLRVSPAYLSQMLHGKRYPNGPRRDELLKVLKPLLWDDLFEEDFG